MRPGRREMLPRGLLSRHDMPFSHRGRAETAEERVVVREKTISQKEAWQVLVD